MRGDASGSSRSPRSPPAAARVAASTRTPTRARSSWSSRARGPARSRRASGSSGAGAISGAQVSGGLGADRVDVGGAHGLLLGTAGARRSGGDGRTPPAPPGPHPPRGPAPPSAGAMHARRFRSGLIADAKRKDRPRRDEARSLDRPHLPATATPARRTTPPPRRRRRSGRGGARRRARARRAAGR